MTMSDDAVYRIQVYTNLTDPSDPFSGTPVYSAPVTYTQDLAGVQTVEVPEVVLMPGSSYAVVLTNAGSKTIQFGVENSTRYKNTNGSVWFTSTAGVAENQTFFKGASASAEWKDVASSGYSFRIKAHTRTLNTKSTLDTRHLLQRQTIMDIIRLPGKRRPVPRGITSIARQRPEGNGQSWQQ